MKLSKWAARIGSKPTYFMKSGKTGLPQTAAGGTSQIQKVQSALSLLLSELYMHMLASRISFAYQLVFY